MTFQRYQFRDLDTKEAAPSLQRDASNFKAPAFSVAPEQVVSKAGVTKLQHFRLDQTVASQLGIEEQERQAFEKRVCEEIERRWEVAKDQAEAAGYTAGLEEGKQQAYKAELPRTQEKVAKLERLLLEFDSMRERIFIANEAFLMDLIAQITRMIVLREVELDQEYIHRVVIALLNQMGTKDNIKVYLSADDLKTVNALKESLQKEFGKLSNTTFEVMKDLTPGSCKIETRYGVVDASLQAQIENVMKSLRT
jgi:flagellar assembly protein FliH